MTLWEGVKTVLLVLFLLSIPLSIISIGGLAFGFYPSEETYSYEVKAQQVFDTDRVEASDVTEFDELSYDEQRVLHDAFKKTDHFMGSSEVTLNYQEERLDTFTDWRTVESNGVLLILAIEEHVEEAPDMEQWLWYHWMVFLGMVYFMLSLLVIVMRPPGV